MRCATRAPGEPLAPRARTPSHPAGCVRPVSRRASSRPTPAASPCTAPCAKPSDARLYNPSRRSRRPTSPGCVQRSASSRIRSRYSAVNWRRFGLATTSGSGVGLARPALGASSLRSSTPRAGTETSFNVIESLSAVIGFHLHRPTEIPKVAGVSVMLAERAGLTRPTGLYVPASPLGLLLPGFQNTGSPRMPAGYDYGVKLTITPAGLSPASTAASFAAPPGCHSTLATTRRGFVQLPAR